jgi:hypothetical protein
MVEDILPQLDVLMGWPDALHGRGYDAELGARRTMQRAKS